MFLIPVVFIYLIVKKVAARSKEKESAYNRLRELAEGPCVFGLSSISPPRSKLKKAKSVSSLASVPEQDEINDVGKNDECSPCSVEMEERDNGILNFSIENLDTFELNSKEVEHGFMGTIAITEITNCINESHLAFNSQGLHEDSKTCMPEESFTPSGMKGTSNKCGVYNDSPVTLLHAPLLDGCWEGSMDGNITSEKKVNSPSMREAFSELATSNSVNTRVLCSANMSPKYSTKSFQSAVSRSAVIV